MELLDLILWVRRLLLKKIWPYFFPENLEKYKNILIPEDTIRFSSEYVKKVFFYLPNFQIYQLRKLVYLCI